MGRLINKINKAKKRIAPRAVYRYGKGQVELSNPYMTYENKSYRWQGKGRRHAFQSERVVETSNYLKLRNTYRSLQYFNPGDTVYVVVYNGFGTKIIKDRIYSVFSFGDRTGYLTEYWLEKSGANTGIEADNIYTSYNQAKFFQHY